MTELEHIAHEVSEIAGSGVTLSNQVAKHANNLDGDPISAAVPLTTPAAVPLITPPLISVVMANYNGAAFIQAALRSVLSQTLTEIEVLVADDASTDDSVARIAAIAATDKRVRLLAGTSNQGPGAARNRCLDAATGRWIAVMDSDDLMHPRRLSRLVAAAEADKADIVADDLLIFYQDRARPPETCLTGKLARAPFWIAPHDYVIANVLFGGASALGYLKPLIRTEVIRAARYDTSLRIAEDYDFILRLMLAGARYRIYPELTYFYRKHNASISHRLGRRTLLPMLAAHDRMQAAVGDPEPVLGAAMRLRRRSIEQALAFDDLVVALKRRDFAAALRLGVSQPAIAARLTIPLHGRLRRLSAAAPPPADGRKSLVLLSRQRIVGHTNGSSVYLLSLCQALRQDGCTVRLVSPSPTVFGRWPAMLLQSPTAVLEPNGSRGAVRARLQKQPTDPRVALRAGLAVLGKLLLRLGVRSAAALTRPAPYAIGQPLTRQDQLFVARHAAQADLLLCDYAFLTDAIPYVLRPGVPSLVVMHDMFSSRASTFSGLAGPDSVALLDLPTEMALLGQADVVVAIQAEEAAIVRAHLRDREVITAPMAIEPVAAAQPGSGTTVMFVGSNAAPNVFGLQWFLRHIWPLIVAAVPEATLLVAGSVGGAVGAVPAGVSLLGRVASLDALYRDAAVVVSPLQAGSGLKIKLIEALGQGKAIVATETTLQGVAAAVRDAVAVADDAVGFAAAVIALLRDPALRAHRCAAALAVARDVFSAEACYGALRAHVRAVLAERLA